MTTEVQGGPAGLARRMFDAYNAEGPNPGKTWDGKDVPPWESLNDQVRGKWTAAAMVAIREVEQGKIHKASYG